MSISFQKVTKSFDDTVALKNFSFEFKKGQTSVLIGSSGCGKSTLLRLVVGLIKHDSGTILIDNQAPVKSNLPFLRKKIGYVIQEGGLFPHLTTKENVSLMAGYTGWDEKKTRYTRVCHPIPNFHKTSTYNAPFRNSTKGYLKDILALQDLHFPPSNR